MPVGLVQELGQELGLVTGVSRRVGDGQDGVQLGGKRLDAALAVETTAPLDFGLEELTFLEVEAKVDE